MQWEVYHYHVAHVGSFALDMRSNCVLIALNEQSERETSVALEVTEAKLLKLLLEKHWCRYEDATEAIAADLAAVRDVLKALDEKVRLVGLVVLGLQNVGFVLLDSAYKQRGGKE